MSFIQKFINVDFNTQSEKIVYVLQQGESNGRQLLFQFRNDGLDYAEPNESVMYKLQIDKPDGTTVIADNTPSSSHSLSVFKNNPLTLQYTVSKNVCACAGVLHCRLSIVSGVEHDTVRTAAFRMRVDAGTKPEEELISTSEYHRFEDFIDNLEALNSQLEKAYEAAKDTETYKQAAETSAGKAADSEKNALDYKNEAKSAETNAKQAAASAISSASSAATVVREAVVSANAAAAAAVNAASAKADESQQSALMAQSYSDGTSGIRRGESTDNSKYYSERSKDSSEISKEYLDKVEQAGSHAVSVIQEALDMNQPHFQVNLSTGCLMYEGGRFYFHVNESGELEWGLTI
ncbi:MAG: hypothetical protein HFI75_00540 [Lachnospiraceae bacterium]|nr:hypothetical protein [Lachnospiraceae bacterium]